MEQARSSQWNLSKQEFLLYEVLFRVLSYLSLSLLTPLLLYRKYKRYAESCVLDGHHLRFEGTLVEAYRRYLLWLLITFGVILLYQYLLTYLLPYLPLETPTWIMRLLTSTVVTALSSVFIRSSLRRWKYQSTMVEGSLAVASSKYQGHMILLVLYQLGLTILQFFSIGLFYPQISYLRMRYECRGVRLSGYQLVFEVKAWELTKKWWKAMPLILLTFGFYALIVEYHMLTYSIQELHLQD